MNILPVLPFPKARKYLKECVRSLAPYPPGPVVDVWVDPQNRNRRFLLLAHLLSGMGLNLRVRWSWSRFRTLNDKGYQAFRSPRVRLAGMPCSTVLTVVDEGTNSSADKVLRVSYEARACPDPLPTRTTFVPLLFHPSLLTAEAFENGRRLAKNRDRRIGAFFAGNLDPEVYDKAIFGEQYGMLNRYEIVQVLREPEFRDWLFEPATWEEFQQALATDSLREKFVLIDVRRFSIPQDRWLELLSEARCFLAPPGYTQPFCHNLIEALSVGAVPLTGYGHLLRPKLTDGVNCLTFDDTEGLRTKLRLLMSGTHLDWEALADAASHYQQEHLSPVALSRVLEGFLAEKGRSEWTLILSGSLT